MLPIELKPDIKNASHTRVMHNNSLTRLWEATTYKITEFKSIINQ